MMDSVIRDEAMSLSDCGSAELLLSNRDGYAKTVRKAEQSCKIRGL